jgi:hypothetical protein
MKAVIKCVLVLLAFSTSELYAQDIPKGLEQMEIIKVAEAYRTATNLSFDVNFTYADSATPASVTEQMAGAYKIRQGKYWGIIDSVEFLQGSQYNMAVYHHDSVIVISGRQEYTSVLQLPLMDSLFREANIADMSVRNLNDSTRSLRILFNRQSPYHSYEMEYDMITYRIRRVKYYLTEMAPDTPGASGVVCVTIQFSNYSENMLSDDAFSESKFVYRFADEVKLQPAYRDFRLMMNVEK